MARTVVVGAGVAGLTAAARLARAGDDVLVLEREAVPGGLARTFRYGDHFFDVGPHRFHTEDAEVAALVRLHAGTDARVIRRETGVRAFGRIHRWPLRAGVLARLPPRLLLAAVRDLAARRPGPGESFESEIVSRYGRTLHDLFFGPYTARFLGLPPGLVHRDWARAGIDRAVIDRRVRAGGLWDLLRGALLPRPAETTFLYPAAGIGSFAERLADEVRAGGGTVQLGAAVSALEASGPRVVAVHAGGERIPCERVVWTGTITSAAGLLGVPAPGLEFLATLLFNLEVRGKRRLPFQWIYFSETEAFVRVSFPSAFSPRASPPGRHGVCVERTCREGDADWANPARLLPAVVEELARTGVIGSPSDVEEVHVERVRDTYPVYALGYREDLRRALGGLSRFENLALVGRGARFWYNNMDHSIAQARRVAAALLRDGRPAEPDYGDREFWAATP